MVTSADQWSSGAPDYLRRIQDQLLPGVRESDFLSDLKAGDGGELADRGPLPPKFLAPYSSAALVVNTFAPFRRVPSELRILTNAPIVTRISFEVKCRMALNPSGSCPNLDAILEADDQVLAIESKFLEYLVPRRPKFGDSDRSKELYRARVAQLALDDPWRELYGELVLHRPSLQADAAQLVKHCLGLRNAFSPSIEKPVKLLYLFWEPLNADEHSVFARHRQEVQEICRRTVHSAVQVEALSYLELWRSWSRASEGELTRTHGVNLMARYGITI